MKDEETKITDTVKNHERPESSDKTAIGLEQSRNRDLWNPTDGPDKPSLRESVAKEKDGTGKEIAGQVPEKARSEVPTAESLHSMMDDAWKRREESGRFDTAGKSAVFYSGEASSSEHRREALGKTEGQRIHSGELAEYHTKHHPDTHIKLEETRGGQELNRIQNWVNSDAVSASDREGLQGKLDAQWSDASQRISESSSKDQSSIAYVEHARDGGVYGSRERPTLESGKSHFHLTDAPLVDGKPPPEDKVPPESLDVEGKYYRA